jgi:hypothetical protein
MIPEMRKEGWRAAELEHGEGSWRVERQTSVEIGKKTESRAGGEGRRREERKAEGRRGEERRAPLMNCCSLTKTQMNDEPSPDHHKLFISSTDIMKLKISR